VASDPQEVVISSDGHTAWVSCQSANEVLGIDTAGWNITDAIQSGKMPDGMALAETK